MDWILNTRIEWIIIGAAVLYFIFTVVFDVPMLRGHWIGNGIKVSRIGDIAWSLTIASWSIPVMTMDSFGKVAPIVMVAVLTGFVVVIFVGLYDSHQHKKRKHTQHLNSADAKGRAAD